jgi:hypothetical protein
MKTCPAGNNNAVHIKVEEAGSEITSCSSAAVSTDRQAKMSKIALVSGTLFVPMHTLIIDIDHIYGITISPHISASNIYIYIYLCVCCYCTRMALLVSIVETML